LNSRVMLDEFDQRVQTLQALMHIAVPQGPFGAIQQALRVVVRPVGKIRTNSVIAMFRPKSRNMDWLSKTE
jgi:hypothetical protein